uniref:Uncharacterized protein n=1 Tax=Anopheles minimus TaxID=112268 RepID=A0A182VZR2_9DIPT
MKGHGILQALVVVLSVTTYFPRCVYAQCGLGSPHMVSFEDYDSDEVIPIVRRLPMPDSNSFKRNYRSHPSVTNPRVLTAGENFPLSDDLVKQLQWLLSANPKKKAMKQKLDRPSVPKPAESYTNTVTIPTTTPPSSTMSTMSTMSTTSKRATETSSNSREIGKKWFKQLLQEAIDNVLRKNSSERDELDEFVDQIAAGSGVYRHETIPSEPYKESTGVTLRNSLDHLSAVESDMVRVNLSSGSGNHLPYLTDQFGSVVPYVVNIFNNTKIGYILMKVSNDSDIRVEPGLLGNKSKNATTDEYIDRKARKILTGTSEEEYKQQRKPSVRNHPNQMQNPKASKLENQKLPYFFKTTPPMPNAGGSQKMEPPFFNILKTPDNESIKYRVLLRNNDALPEKGNIRLPKSQHAVKVLTGDRRSNHANGRQGSPKRKSFYYSEEKPTIMRNHHPLSELVQVESVEYVPDSRPAGRHSIGPVVRKYDFESLEEELPLEEPDITYPDTNTVTQRTATILASGKHNLPAMKSNEKRHRSTSKPYTESQRYNFRRTFGSTDADTDANEHSTKPTPSSRRDTFSIADLPGDDVLFNQATANVLVKTKKDSRLREDAYRRQPEESDGPLKMSFDTSDGGLNDLFERGTGRSKRILKKSDSRWESENSSEEEEDSSSS